VYQLKGSRNNPIINSGATSTCSRQIKLFKSLDQRYGGSLGTARKLNKIASRGIIKILLSSGCMAKVRNMLYMPRIRNTILLLTQALQDIGIWNKHVAKTYQFFKKRGDILAKGYNIGWTSYLGWVSHKSALASGHEN
jgi:hypothetical protein